MSGFIPLLKNIMPKTKIKNTTIESGICRIEEIKSTISSLKPQVCKAEVYETWDNIFETETE